MDLLDSLDEALFIDEGSEWAGSSDGEPMSCDDDSLTSWSVDTFLGDGTQQETHEEDEQEIRQYYEMNEEDEKSGDEMTLNDMIQSMFHHSTEVTEPRWDDMDSLLERDPRSARVTDNSGLLPLHYALYISEPKLSTIRALVAAYPKALSLQAPDVEERRLPLHIAAGNPETTYSILRMILYAHEEAVMKPDLHGMLPLHVACGQFGSVSSVWELLHFFPEGAKKTDNKGLLPVDSLMQVCRRINFEAIPQRMKRKQEHIEYLNYTRIFNRWIDQDMLFWADAQLLLMAQHHGKVPPIPPSDSFEEGCFITIEPHSIPGVEKFRALHAAAATGAHQIVVDLVLKLYPEQLEETDEQGRLPLHCACIAGSHKMFYCNGCERMKSDTILYGYSNPEAYSEFTVCEKCYEHGVRFAVEHGMSASKPIQFSEGEEDRWKRENISCDKILDFAKQTSDTVAERINKANPAAAGQTDNHGRYPLHYLVAAPLHYFRNPSALSSLVEAYPAAADIRDEATGLLPIETVALASLRSADSETDTEQLDLIYYLLRRNPAYVNGLLG